MHMSQGIKMYIIKNLKISMHGGLSSKQMLKNLVKIEIFECTTRINVTI